MIRPRLIQMLVALSTCAIASAQSFNLDLNGPTPETLPSSSYGAAANQPGAWNAFTCPQYCDGLELALVDLAGASTSASATATSSGQPVVCDDPAISGDDAALLESGMRVFSFDYVLLDVRGLDAGTYDLYVYVGRGCQAAGSTLLTLTTYLESTPGVPVSGTVASQAQTTSGAGWDGGFADDANFGRFRFRLPPGHVVDLLVQTSGALQSAHGIQLVKRDGSTQAVCFGTNELTRPCPCGTSAWERGCPSSFQPLGAALSGSGSAQISADGLQITASDVSNSMVTLFQGTQIVGGQAGLVFGDGLRCAGGSVIRIVTKASTLGVMHYPEAGEIPISVRGAVPASGGYRAYQVWYRNAANYCTPSTFNLTNAVAVDWDM